MEPTVASNYDPRIDQLRAFACCLVATVHVGVPGWTDKIIETGFYIDSVLLAVIHTGWIGVPLFLFVSGYSLSLNKIATNASLNIKQFAFNRILRLLPLWAICIVLIARFWNLDGTKVLNLILFQMQDLPSSTPFNIAWSLQLEMACYLLFPIFFFALCKKNINQILVFYLFFLVIRIYLHYHTSNTIWSLSYGTIFGGATIFLTGMYATTLKPLKNGKLSYVCFYFGIFLFLMFCTIVHNSGGYQNPKGPLIHYIFLFMPEIVSCIMFLILRGFLTQKETRKPENLVTQGITFFGKISYSAYLFSLFTNDFISRYVPIVPSGWISFLQYLIIYYLFLTIISSLSFYAIEKPFLDLRKNYLKK